MHCESSSFLVLAFRTIVLFSIQFHRRSLIWRSEPLYIFIRGPWVTIFLWLEVQSHFSSTISFRVTIPCIHIRWHYTSYLQGLASILVFLTVLSCARCLSVIALPDFSPHCSWRSPLSLRRILRSCCWAPFTWHFHVVLLGQSPRGIFIIVLRVIFGEVLERVWVFGTVPEALWEIHSPFRILGLFRYPWWFGWVSILCVYL